MAEDITWDAIIVGGGIVGAATFFKLQSRFPQKRLLLIEKEPVLSDHQTGHFTGPYERRILPGIGHNVPQEAPTDTVAALRDLMRAHPR